MGTLQIVFSVLLAGSVVYTIVGYPKKYGALSGRSRLFRTLGIALVDLLLVLVLLHSFIDFRAGVTKTLADVREVLYLLSCLCIGFTLVFIALLDALESFVTVRKERRAFVEQMIRDEVALIEQKRLEKGNIPASPS